MVQDHNERGETMIYLQTFKGAFGEPSASPFCTKAMCLLQMSGVDWKADFSADVRKAPMKKLPVLLDGDQVIPDSSLIMAHLERAHGANFNGSLSVRERGEAHAITRMAEEHMVFALTYNRWCIDANWEHLKEKFFGFIPFPMRGFVAKKVRKNTMANIRGQGMGRFDEAGVVARIEHDLAVISERVSGGFLFGGDPVAADLSVGAVLSGLESLPETTLLRERVRGDQVLMSYVTRFREEFYEPLEAKFKEDRA